MGRREELGRACPFEVEAVVAETQPALPSVKGRLKEHVGFWMETIQASRDLLVVIEKGYALTLKEHPPPFFRKNQLSLGIA